MSLHVVEAGLATRIVDGGRPAARSLGVPVGGAADCAALALGNALAGNLANAPALEVCLKGPVLRAEADVGCVLFGVSFGSTLGRRSVRTGTTFTLRAGEVLDIGAARWGMRAYLCVRGGWSAPSILGSASALEVVKAGDVLACAGSYTRGRCYGPDIIDELYDNRFTLRALAGAQADSFDEPAFFAQELTVTPALDRMGIRLQGWPLPVPNRELISEPVCPGAVQVTRDGQCIVLGVDGQTIGGYPKVAQVIQADLDRLGQLRPGDIVHFQKVELADAAAAFRERQAFLAHWCRRARVSLDGC